MQDPRPPAYTIDTSMPSVCGMNPALLIGRRTCATCRSERPDEALVSADPRELIDLIRACCSRKFTYMGQTAPFRDMIFRVILARSNKPTTAEEIAGAIRRSRTQRFVRRITPLIVEALLRSDNYYGFMPDTRRNTDAPDKAPAP